MSKTVAVFGATGAQGGSVVRYLLQEPSKWKVIALTRDVNSEKAKALQATGAELRACDMGNAESVENALKGSYAVFGVTDFWGSKGKEEEMTQGLNILNAAKKVGVQHLVFSTLENSTKLSQGKRHVHHFDSKSEVEEQIVKSGVPYTLVEPACYLENLKQMVRPSKEGNLEFALPIPGDTKYAQFSVGETGLTVRAVLNNREKYLGKKLALTGDYISPDEMAVVLSKQFGKPVKFNFVPEKIFASFPMPGAEELATMFCFFHECGYYGEKVQTFDIWSGKQATPELSTLEQWAKDWKM